MRALRSGVLLAALCVTCAEGRTPLAPDAVDETASTELIAVTCSGDVRAATMTCTSPRSTSPAGAGGPAFLVLGGQGEFVQLHSDPATVSYAAGLFTFSVSVENLIGQTIGVPGGVRVFFSSPPVVLEGTGDITVQGDGIGAFTASDQPYYQYDEEIAPGGESRARVWTLAMPSTVIRFSFGVYVDANVPSPDGWITAVTTAGTLDLATPAVTATVTATRYDALGRELPATFEFSSSAPEVASVDPQTGIVTAEAVGTATITAAAGGLTGTVDIEVEQLPAVSVDIELLGYTWEEVVGYTLPADGTTEVDVLVTFRNANGSPVPMPGATFELRSQGLTQHTPGGTISEPTENGDGTWSATLTSPVSNGTSGVHVYVDDVYWNTAGITYTGGNNIPTVPPPGPQCSIPAFPTPCSQVVFISWKHIIEDSSDNPFVLDGSDADGQPLTAEITEVFALSPVAEWKKQDGTPITLGDVIDPAVLFTPHPDGFGPFYARLQYVLSDGLSRSEPATVRVFVDGVNDPPRHTLASDLLFYEDTDNNFLLGGFDVEGNIYSVRFTVRPDNIGSLYHRDPQGDVLITPATTTIDGSSDIGFGWPMHYIPAPNDWGAVTDDYYEGFCFVLEEVPGGLTGPENCVEIRIAAVNDQPLTNIAGIGNAAIHDLNTSLIEDGVYSLPAMAITDVDTGIGPVPDPELAVSIAVSGSGILTLDTFDYEDAGVVFSVSDNLITFSMRQDVSDMGFRPDLTLDNLLNSLRYQAAGGMADTLTITIDDQGNYGVCSPGDHTDPCPKQSVTTINMSITAGAPPAEGTMMVLTPAGG